MILEYLSESDTIEYIPTKQVGIIVKIHEAHDEVKYQLKLIDPDEKIWCGKEDIKLLYPVG